MCGAILKLESGRANELKNVSREFASMISDMLSIDPKSRLSIEEMLSRANELEMKSSSDWLIADLSVWNENKKAVLIDGETNELLFDFVEKHYLIYDCLDCGAKKVFYCEKCKRAAKLKRSGRDKVRFAMKCCWVVELEMDMRCIAG